MYLVDKQIKQLIEQQHIIDNVPDESIGCIGCDISIDHIIGKQGEKKENFTLEPSATVMIATKEILHLPNNIVAHIIPKNSRIRMGLRIDAPVYQPGHETRIFIAVTNVSDTIIELESGEQIAAVAFSLLPETPENTYTGTFKDEDSYKGLAAYDSVWNRRIKQINDKYKNIKGLEKSIYSNVIILMTIFIGIFSLINFEISFIKLSIDLTTMLVYNLIFVGAVSTLVAIINTIIPQSGKMWHKLLIFLVPIVCFFTAICLL